MNNKTRIGRRHPIADKDIFQGLGVLYAINAEPADQTDMSLTGSTMTGSITMFAKPQHSCKFCGAFDYDETNKCNYCGRDYL